MKDTLFIFGVCLLAIAGGAALYFNHGAVPVGNQAAAADTSGQVAITVLAQGSNAVSLPKRVNYRVRNQDQLEYLWNLAYGTSTAPEMDFVDNDVLAVFDGNQPTGGYTVSISDVNDGHSSRTVTIVHGAPRGSCMETDMVTHPFEFVSVPKSSLHLVHVDDTTTLSCN